MKIKIREIIGRVKLEIESEYVVLWCTQSLEKAHPSWRLERKKRTKKKSWSVQFSLFFLKAVDRSMQLLSRKQDKQFSTVTLGGLVHFLFGS